MKINNLEFKVMYDDDFTEAMGKSNFIPQTIIINPILKTREVNLKRTLMHEVIHCYLYAYGFTNKEKFELEEMIEFISHNYDNIGEITNQALKELEGVDTQC